MASPTNSAQSLAVIYRERQWVPWWWWVVGIAVALLLSAQLHLGRPEIWTWAPYFVFLPVVIGALWHMCRHRVVVRADGQGSGVLEVDGASLPFDAMGTIVAVPKSAKQAAMGRQLDPAAFVAQSPWVKEMVYIAIDDPDDPTPYWLISSVDAEAMVDALPASAIGSSLDSVTDVDVLDGSDDD